MAKRTKRRRDRPSKRKFSRRRYSKRRVSRKKNPKRKVSKKRYTKRMKGGMEGVDANVTRLVSMRSGARASPPSVEDLNITTLVELGLGISKEEAKAVLDETGGDIKVAANKLITAKPSGDVLPAGAGAVPEPAPAPAASPASNWVCRICTLENVSDTDVCAACNNPRIRTAPPAPAPAPALERERQFLGIMRHSLRLDNELDKINNEYNKQQQYYIDEFSYNTPLANDKNIDPEIQGVNLKDVATGKILVSIERGLRDYNFDCIITSPFTRCLQTAEIVRINLGIPKQNIYVNFNLREDDLALRGINNKKYEVGDPRWNDVEPYNGELIRNVAGGGIESYVKQTLDEIFNKYKHLGNVLIITHGDIYNKYVPELFEGVGSSKLEEAGWAIFAPPSKDILANAGVGFFTDLSS
jgi:hypothetical protein